MLHGYADGKPLGEVSLPASAVFGGACVAKGMIYVAGTDGSVSGFR